MPLTRLANLIALAACASAIPCARAQAEEAAGEGTCGDDSQNTVEIGGGWDEELFALDLGPDVGWFLSDGVELTRILRFVYAAAETDGDVLSIKSGVLVFEPTYRFAIRDESIFAFGMLGVQLGNQADHADFEIVPRVGLNIEVGRTRTLNPALRVPIMFGKKVGPDDGDGVMAGFAIEAALTTTL